MIIQSSTHFSSISGMSKVKPAQQTPSSPPIKMAKFIPTLQPIQPLHSHDITLGTFDTQWGNFDVKQDVRSKHLSVTSIDGTSNLPIKGINQNALQNKSTADLHAFLNMTYPIPVNDLDGQIQAITFHIRGKGGVGPTIPYDQNLKLGSTLSQTQVDKVNQDYADRKAISHFEGLIANCDLLIPQIEDQIDDMNSLPEGEQNLSRKKRLEDNLRVLLTKRKTAEEMILEFKYHKALRGDSSVEMDETTARFQEALTDVHTLETTIRQTATSSKSSKPNNNSQPSGDTPPTPNDESTASRRNSKDDKKTQSLEEQLVGARNNLDTIANQLMEGGGPKFSATSDFIGNSTLLTRETLRSVIYEKDGNPFTQFHSVFSSKKTSTSTVKSSMTKFAANLNVSAFFVNAKVTGAVENNLKQRRKEDNYVGTMTVTCMLVTGYSKYLPDTLFFKKQDVEDFSKRNPETHEVMLIDSESLGAVFVANIHCFSKDSLDETTRENIRQLSGEGGGKSLTGHGATGGFEAAKKSNEELMSQLASTQITIDYTIIGANAVPGSQALGGLKDKATLGDIQALNAALETFQSEMTKSKEAGGPIGYTARKLTVAEMKQRVK